MASLGGAGIEVGQAGREISEAKSGEKMRVAGVAGAELAGEELGAGICDALSGAAVAAAPESAGISLLVIPAAAMVGCGAVGGYVAKRAAEHEVDYFKRLFYKKLQSKKNIFIRVAPDPAQIFVIDQCFYLEQLTKILRDDSSVYVGMCWV